MARQDPFEINGRGMAGPRLGSLLYCLVVLTCILTFMYYYVSFSSNERARELCYVLPRSEVNLASGLPQPPLWLIMVVEKSSFLSFPDNIFPFYCTFINVYLVLGTSTYINGNSWQCMLFDLFKAFYRDP